MTDVARGIAEIHKKNDGKLVHGNIKASNIFHGPKIRDCISDMGLATMIETTFASSAWCYAPEVKSSKDVSQASDVYSFGVLMLELLTRKSSVHVPGGPKAVDLVKLVRSKRASKVIDPDLWHDSPVMHGVLTEMLEVAIKCVAKSVKKRPKMSQVVNILEEIHVIYYTLNASSVAQVSLVFLDDDVPRFDLEDALEGEAVVLGRGSFGTSYKATLQNGNTAVVVKRLRDVVVSENVFQEQMEMFGRMKHKNVADIMAYHYSTDEKLVFYHYFGEISISALLHGRRGHVRKALNWKTRLNIAIDAGMGIAHIHGKDGGKLVHGNIKSSNIFLVEQNRVILSDAGYTKLPNPIKLSARQNQYWYHAPEVKHTWQVSQASDVYSFGDFLIELVSGLPPQHMTDDGNTISLVEWFQSAARDEWIHRVLDEELLTYRNGKEDEDAGIIRFLLMAMDCVNREPWRRPHMSQVVKVLGEISHDIISIPEDDDASGEEWQWPCVESRLENLLLGMLPKMAP